MRANSRSVTSSQRTVHSALEKVVQKHLDHQFRKPIPDYQREIFQQAIAQIPPQTPLILDSGCGVGESTRHLAQMFPQCFILGVDQSLHRLSKSDPQGENYRLIRADLVDFWRLMAQASISLTRHYILYPNPYPKPVHFKRRWHGHPVFPTLLQLGGILELRSNWQIYVAEFAQAFHLATGTPGQWAAFTPSSPLTPFERKYHESGHQLWRFQGVVNRGG
ncbi:tRNA (guanine(46)-N(7))-methyltransferase TrmB [Spirulina subsalsa]|uniref:tRNA (guanine(46)-N(7))-methyltransferase TrmB n=1 Tax=Spirulina subsalsa TaxID=54311 RepID=UPI0002F97F3E|nr:hypothetical protein [Spirulina subsalsa]